MIQLRHLKTFLAAAETLSFTQAAQRVHLSQPSVTEQVRALEEELGQALFVRANNRLTLTPAGRQLAARARELLAMADDALHSVREGHHASVERVTVAAPQTLCARVLAPAAAALAREEPLLRVVVRELNSRATVDAVVEGMADFGLLHGWPAEDAEADAQLLGRDAPVVVMPRGHPLAMGGEITPSALARHAMVATGDGCRYRGHLDALLQQAGTRAVLRAEAETVPVLLQLVACGVGIAVLPRLAAEAGAAPLQLALRELRDAGEGLPVCAVTPLGRPLRAGAARLLERVRAAMPCSDQPVSAFDVENLPGRIPVPQ